MPPPLELVLNVSCPIYVTLLCNRSLDDGGLFHRIETLVTYWLFIYVQQLERNEDDKSISYLNLRNQVVASLSSAKDSIYN